MRNIIIFSIIAGPFFSLQGVIHGESGTWTLSIVSMVVALIFFVIPVFNFRVMSDFGLLKWWWLFIGVISLGLWFFNFFFVEVTGYIPWILTFSHLLVSGYGAGKIDPDTWGS